MKPPIRALVVDDEPLARVNLRALLDPRPQWKVVGESGSGASALETIHEQRPEVVFLDIRMPGLDGLQVAKVLATLDPRPLVVFATAFEEHALEAFAVEASDYLLKPFDQERFLLTVGRLERRLRPSSKRAGESSQHSPVDTQLPTTVTGSLQTGSPQKGSPQTGSPQTGSPQTGSPQTLAVRSVGRVRLIAVDDIHWVAAAGNYVRLYLADACFLHRSTLAALEKQLDEGGYLRIHRSTLVNRQQVVELKTSVEGRYQLVLRDGTELEISQRFKRRVFAALLPAR